MFTKEPLNPFVVIAKATSPDCEIYVVCRKYNPKGFSLSRSLKNNKGKHQVYETYMSHIPYNKNPFEYLQSLFKEPIKIEIIINKLYKLNLF